MTYEETDWQLSSQLAEILNNQITGLQGLHSISGTHSRPGLVIINSGCVSFSFDGSFVHYVCRDLILTLVEVHFVYFALKN